MTLNDWLIDWWGWFNIQNYDGKLLLLKAAAKEQSESWELGRKNLKSNRARFDKRKARGEFPFSDKCKLCERPFGENYQYGYFARHHIIELYNGGCNRRLNIMTLCDLCHAEIHYWLKPKTVRLFYNDRLSEEVWVREFLSRFPRSA